MTFVLDDDLSPIHQPVRLRLMALLFRERDVGFAQARDALGLTDGNLGAHAKVLESLGWLTSRRALEPTGFQTRYLLTAAGSQAFRRYTTALQGFLDTVDGG